MRLGLFDITREDAIAELERELEARRVEYPALIRDARLDMETATTRFVRLEHAIELLKQAEPSSNDGVYTREAC